MQPKYVPPFRRPPERNAWALQRYSGDPHHPNAWNRLHRADNQERARNRFVQLMQSRGLEAIPYAVTADAPCAEHLILVRDRQERRVVMVQAQRRVQHSEGENGQDAYAFLELQREATAPLGSPRLGWLRACPADEVAFELRNGFLVVPRLAVLQLAEQIEQANANAPPIRHFRYPRQIYRKLFSRDDASTGLPSGALLTLVSVRHDLMPLARAHFLQSSA